MKVVDEFTQSYLKTALWSSTTGEDSTPLDQEYTLDDIDPTTLKNMIKDCKTFQQIHKDDIESCESYQFTGEELAGSRFWLVRNGHGASFFDDGWGEEVAERLEKGAKAFGEFYLDVFEGVIYDY